MHILYLIILLPYYKPTRPDVRCIQRPFSEQKQKNKNNTKELIIYDDNLNLGQC